MSKERSPKRVGSTTIGTMLPISLPPKTGSHGGYVSKGSDRGQWRETFSRSDLRRSRTVHLDNVSGDLAYRMDAPRVAIGQFCSPRRTYSAHYLVKWKYAACMRYLVPEHHLEVVIYVNLAVLYTPRNNPSPRQWQTRRKPGTQSDGPNPHWGMAAALPNGAFASSGERRIIAKARRVESGVVLCGIGSWPFLSRSAPWSDFRSPRVRPATR